MAKHIKPKTRFIITLTVITAILLLLSFAVFYYALPTITEESGNIEKTNAKLATLEEKKNILLAEAEKIKSLSTNINAVEAAIVPANNPVALFGVLERLANHEHLTIDIKPAAEASNASPDTLILNISVTGTMKQGIEFIKNISNIPFIVTISNITLSQNIVTTSTETKSGAKTITPVLGDTTLTMTLLVTSHP